MKPFAHNFAEHVQELRTIRRYELTCQCKTCTQTLYRYKESIIIEGFDLSMQSALKMLEKNENDKYPMSYIGGKFIHKKCISQPSDHKALIGETLGRLAFYRLANDDTEFCNELKQFMKEVKHRNLLATDDISIDNLTADELIEAIHTTFRPYGEKQ